MRTVILKRRPADHHASLADEPGKWGCGSTPSEALGDLVRSFPGDFGITIERPNTQPLPPAEEDRRKERVIDLGHHPTCEYVNDEWVCAPNCTHANAQGARP